MKYSDLVKPPKLLVRRSTLDAMVECRELVEQLLENHMLEPVNPKDRVLLYRVVDVEKAVEQWARSKVY